MVGQRFSDHAEVGIIFFDAENRRAAHAVERLEDHIAMLLPERAQLLFVARHQRVWRQVGKPGSVEFFIAVTQALRFVNDQRALLFRALQQISGVNELGIKRRVFTHQHHVKIGQRDSLLAAKRVPLIVVLLDAQQPGARVSHATAQRQIAHLHVVNFITAALCFQQHGEAGVFFNVDGRNRVHNDAKLNHYSLLKGEFSHPVPCESVVLVSYLRVSSG